MKKIVAIVLVLCMTITVFTGCSKAVETKTVTPEAIKTEAVAPAAEQVPTPAPVAETPSPAPATETIAPAVETTTAPAEPTAVATPAPLVKAADTTVKPTETKSPEQQKVEPVKASVNENVVFTDGLGKSITLKKNPKRVVSLYTSYVDLWDMAGGALVGRPDTKESVPAAVKDAETIGSYMNPNLEKILSLQPDLILINTDVKQQVALIPMLEKSNIPYIALKYDTFKDYLKLLKIYTDLTGREDLYQTKGINIEKKIDSIIAKVPKNKKPSILLLLGSSKSVSVRLPNTTVGEMLQDLGTVNIAYDASLKASDMEVFSMERVIEKDPDFIFVQTMGDVDETTARIKKDIEANPAWNYLKAVKQGNYIFLEKELFLFKPNDRYAEAYEKLAKMVYPEVFK